MGHPVFVYLNREFGLMSTKLGSVRAFFRLLNARLCFEQQLPLGKIPHCCFRGRAAVPDPAHETATRAMDLHWDPVTTAAAQVAAALARARQPIAVFYPPQSGLPHPRSCPQSQGSGGRGPDLCKTNPER
jgi:hypothetical protein